MKQNENNGICIALGFFDGLHLGHKALLGSMINFCNKNGYTSSVFTFHDDFHFLYRNKGSKLIFTEDERRQRLHDFGIENIYFATPSEFFFSMQAEDFENYLLSNFKLKAIFVGNNFKYGKNAAKDAKMLKDFCLSKGIYCHIEKDMLFEGRMVSSSLIRTYLIEGKVDIANLFLGENFVISGIVYNDRQVGRTLGYNTANISLNPNQLIPQNGVYYTQTMVDGVEYDSITHIGPRPTFGLENISVETHVIDSKLNLYRKHITLKFFRKIRDILKFSSPDELRAQIIRDIEKIKDA